MRADQKAASRYRRWLLLAAFLTFDLIMLGAFVRVSDAGLGCPDWPGCYGKLSPIHAAQEISAAVAVQPDGPVTHFKAWVEMIHRYIASGLGLISILLVVFAWRARGAARGEDQRAQKDAPAWRPSLVMAVVTLAWIILQGMFGMWTVTMRLQPAVVTAHLLGGVVLFLLYVAQVLRMKDAELSGARGEGARGLRALGWIALAVVMLQIALGGWVSSNYATLACSDFPTCHGVWWPEVDIRAGFEWWRPLGRSSSGEMLPFQALTAIHVVHRIGALAVLVVCGAMAWLAMRHEPTRRWGWRLLLLLGLQIATGITNVFLDWPLLVAILHTAGATAIAGTLLVLEFKVSPGTDRRRMASVDTARRHERSLEHDRRLELQSQST